MIRISQAESYGVIWVRSAILTDAADAATEQV
jgi:hypothetical protein